MDECGFCGADLRAEKIPEKDRALFGGAKYFSRRVGLSHMDLDRVVAWKCPDCGTEVSR